MQNPNPGSFMAPAGGGGSAVVAAMQRRGMLPGATNQVGPGAPGGASVPQIPSVGMQTPSPMPPPQPGQPMPGGMPPGGAVGPDGETPPTPGTPPNLEAQMIVKAMDSRLKSISKVEQGTKANGLY